MCLVYLDMMNHKSCLLLCRRDHGHVVQIMVVNCCDSVPPHKLENTGLLHMFGTGSGWRCVTVIHREQTEVSSTAWDSGLSLLLPTLS